jgi:hypothetical protein
MDRNGGGPVCRPHERWPRLVVIVVLGWYLLWYMPEQAMIWVPISVALLLLT